MAKFNLPQLTKEQKQNLAGAVVMLVVGTYLYIHHLWNPWSKRIAEDRQKIMEVRNKIQSAQQEARRLDQLEKEMAALSLQAQDAEKRLPKTRDMPTVFDTIHRLTQHNKVQLVSFAPGPAATKTYFIEIAYQISIVGKYHDVGRFLASISTEERIYNIKDVSFALGGSDDKKLNVTFTLLAYQYRG